MYGVSPRRVSPPTRRSNEQAVEELTRHDDNAHLNGCH
jgi:hypothetical protein